MRWGQVAPKMKDALHQGLYGAEDVVTASSVTNFLAPIGVGSKTLVGFLL